MSLSPIMGNLSQKHTPETKEVFYPKSQVILFSGFLGSGKTTFINNIFPNIEGKVKIIVNDIGSINIDATRFDGKDTVSLQAGCVCCEDEKSLLEALESISKEEEKTGQPITIILEPSGIADGKTIHNILKRKGFSTKTITTFDALNFTQHKEISEDIFKHQIQIADIIGVTKSEVISDNLKHIIGEINHSAPLLKVPEASETPKTFPDIWEQIKNLETEKKQQIEQIFSPVSPLGEQPHRNPLVTKSSEKALSKADVYLLKSLFGNQLPRAKGTLQTGEQFDIVGGDIKFHNGDKKEVFFSLMSTDNFEFDDIFSQIQTIKNYNLSEQKIQALIEDYNRYIFLDNKKNTLLAQLQNGGDNHLHISTLELEMKELGDAMKYDNPYIWLKYKIEAYKNGENAINTIEDLIHHCNVPDYICGKRLAFMHEYLQERYDIDIYTLEPDTDLKEFLKNNTFQELSQDPDFIEQWLEYEYFIENGRVAKWENYSY